GSPVATTATAPQAQGGSCAPSAVNKNVTPATWNLVAQGCMQTTTPTQGACGTDELCAPMPDPGYHICIVSNFNVPCPAGAYSTKRTVYQGRTDLRDCTACTCSAVTATCVGSLTFYAAPNCTGPQQSQPSSCTALPPTTRFFVTFTPSPPIGGSC